MIREWNDALAVPLWIQLLLKYNGRSSYLVGGKNGKSSFLSYFADVDISEEYNAYRQESVDTGHNVGVETEGFITY